VKLTAEERIDYLRAVWDVFKAKAKTKRDMTNSEYYMATRWLDHPTDREDVLGNLITETIPLVVICRAIEDFEGKPNRLEALAVPVEKAYAQWRQSMGITHELE